MTKAGDTDSPQKTKVPTLLATLALGHMAIHWFQQLWPVILPSVKASLGLSDIQLGTLASLKQFTTGPLNLPSGILADFFRKRTALILAGSFLFLGLSHLLVAQASTFLWIIPFVALLGIGTALWHPAAVASLSLRFPERRGSALAVHGVGASVGDTVAPILIGLLLLTLSWQRLLEIHMIPALLIGLVMWKVLDSIYRNEEGIRPSMGTYLEDSKRLLQNRTVLAMIGVNVFTGMARLSIITFLPIYIQEDLDYSTLGLGVFWGLLHAMGAVSQPAMGYFSDKFGRKAVLLPSLVTFGLLYLALSVADPGIQLILVIGALGLFFYALATITQAAVMDVASDKVQASTVGIISVITQFVALPSPIIAGVLVTRYGTESTFLYAGSLTLLAALLLVVIRVPRSERSTPRVLG